MAKVLILGGPGNISSTAILELLRRGDQVTVMTLPGSQDDDGVGKQCGILYANRDNQDDLQKVFEQIRPDAVVDFCCFHPKQLSVLLPFVDGQCKQYVFVSTCDVYGYPLSHLPMREQDEWHAPNCRYAVDKLACESFLRHEMKETAVTVIRPSYSMGKRFALTALSRQGGRTLVPRLRAGLPVLSPNKGRGLIHASNAKDTGRMIACTVLNKPSFGTSYTCASEHARTYDEYIGLFADALGVSPIIVHISDGEIYRLANAAIYEENLLNDLTKHDISFSVEHFKQDFPDFRWEHPVEEAVRDYIAFQDAHGGFTDLEDPVESSVLKRFLQKT